MKGTETKKTKSGYKIQVGAKVSRSGRGNAFDDLILCFSREINRRKKIESINNAWEMSNYFAEFPKRVSFL